jgi:hypothetical protein
MARRGRQAALLAALGAGAAGVFGVIFAWPRLVEEYRLWELRREPARFERYFFAADRAEEAAARRFVREPRGREALLALYVTEDIGLSSRSLKNGVLGGAVSGQGVVARGLQQSVLLDLTGAGGLLAARHCFSVTPGASDVRRLAKILEQLPACVGHTLRPEESQLEFEVVPVTAGHAGAPSWREPGKLTFFANYPDIGHVCYYRTRHPSP